MNNLVQNRKKEGYFFKLKEFAYSKVVIRCKILRRKIYQILDREVDKRKLMVNIGGGNFFRRHWRVLNFPSKSYKFRWGVIDYEHDLTSGEPLPFKDKSVSIIYSSHTLEHIPQEYCSFIFSEMYRILKQGGAVRITVPDFDKAADAYATNDQYFFGLYSGNTIEEKFLDNFATFFCDKENLNDFRRNFSSMSREEFADSYTSKIPRKYHSEHSGGHINWWNYHKLHKMLKEAGFTEIWRSAPQESRFVEMRDVKRKKDFDSTHPEISLFVEAMKDI